MRTSQFGMIVLVSLLASLMVGCSSNASPDTHVSATSSAKPCYSSAGLDLLCYLSVGEQNQEGIDEAHQLGLEKVYNPRSDLKKTGVVGLSPLGTSCMVILTREGTTSITTISVHITNRYNISGIEMLYWGNDLTPQDAKVAIQRERNTCLTDHPTPAPTPSRTPQSA